MISSCSFCAKNSQPVRNRHDLEQLKEMDERKMSGVLYGVGVGPGDPELLTVKALNCIKRADVIVLPAAEKESCHAYRIVRGCWEEIEEKNCICLPFPMTREAEKLAAAHDKIYETIQTYLEENKTVALLTIGDPAVYSTYCYIHKRVVQQGGEARMISGVPSFCAAAAALSIPLAESGEEIHIIPAAYDVSKAEQLSGTRVYMKSGRQRKQLKERLEEEMKSKKLEVYCVENCGMENQKITCGLEEWQELAGYLSIVIVKEKQDENGNGRGNY